MLLLINNLLPIINIDSTDFKYYLNLRIDIKYLLINLFILKNHQTFRFNLLSTISCVDFPELINRFELNYTLFSLDYPCILNLKIKVSEFIAINSSSLYFKSAVWLEREIWDLFGVYFKNNFDLRRILTDYGFPYHPLRKTFPLIGFIQVYYNFINKKVQYHNIYFSQNKSYKRINSIWLNFKF